MGILKDRFLILSLIFGFIIRLSLTQITGFKFDVDTWFAWAERLNSVGFAHFYSDRIWTSYPPGFLYILSLLGFLKNLLQIESSLFYIILKIPSILAELAIGIFIYRLIPNSWKRVGLIFVMLNPAFIFNSAIFGQFDGLFSLALLVSVYFLIQKGVVYSSVFAGISLLLKPQAILLFPIFLYFILKNFSIKIFLKMIISSSLLIFFLFLPFFRNDPVAGPINLISNILGYYKYNSIFAYNFWGIFGVWVPDNTVWKSLTYQYWGYILFALFWIVIIWRKKNLSLYALSALSSLSFFFLLTRMHERYLYPSLVFLIIVAILKKSRSLLIFSVILSLIHFLNLYFVYIYYNVFYLKMSSSIYNQYLYNFADQNLKFISFFSTVIFLLISTNIIKLHNDHKKV